MNIIHTVPTLIPESGGPARSVTGLCTALAKAGNRIELLALDVGHNFGPPLIPQQELVTTIFVPNRIAIGLRQLWAPGYKKALSDLAQEKSVALMHDHCIWLPTNIAMTTVARKFGIPFVVSVRGMLEPWALQFSRRKKQWMWHLYQRSNLEAASVLHATAEAEAENLRRLGLRQPIAVIPNGIDLPELGAAKQVENRGKKTLLFLSRIHPVKGLLNLIEALQQIPIEGWQIVIAGPNEGGHQAEVEAAIRKAQLENICSFIGPISDEAKWRVYRQADLFVLPTFSENFGIVIAEALASELPVITTTATPWQELISHRCGWWIDPQVEPLVNALREAMLLPKEELHTMGQRGRKLVESRYGWSKIAKEMISVYRWILGQEVKPGCVWIEDKRM